jgi:hypothetical protein
MAQQLENELLTRNKGSQTMNEIIAIVGFSTKKSRPIANKKFSEKDAPQRTAAYLLEILLREELDFVSIRKVRPFITESLK